MIEKTKQLHPKYTRARTSGNRAEVYDSERDTWLPLWIALGYMNHADMTYQLGSHTGVDLPYEDACHNDSYSAPSVDCFDGSGGDVGCDGGGGE
jgi:hypothetical protein